MTPPKIPVFRLCRERIPLLATLCARTPWFLLLVAAVSIGLTPAISNAAGRRGSDGKDEGFFGITPYFQSGPFTTVQRVKGTVSTTFGPTDNPQNTLTNMGWLFEVGASGPAMEKVPGAPRVNVFGGVLVPLNESGVIGSKVGTSTFAMTNDILLEETKMQVEYQTGFRVGIGAEFAFNVFDTTLKIMPGAQYLYLGSRYAGQVASTRVYVDNPARPNDERSQAAKNAFVQQLLGPSLKISTDSLDVFGLRFDLFVEGSLLFDVAGTREQSRFTDPGDGATSVYTWEVETTSGVFNAGFRIRLP